MNNIFISVIMPVRNAEHYLGEAIKSVLRQTVTDFEFLITDDGSSDESPEILRRYAESDPRIRLVPRRGEGYLIALNEMLAEACGKFVARMDADDVSMPDRLERQVAYLEANPECLVIGCRILVVDPDGDPLCIWNEEQRHEEIDVAHLDGGRGAVICHPTAVMRRDAVLAVGGYRERFYTAEDLDLFLRLAERGLVANLPDVLLKYRMHPASICHKQKPRQNQAIHAAIAEARDRRGLPPDSRPAPNPDSEPVVEPYRPKWAWWALKAGNIATARKHAVASLVEAPFSIDSWRLMFCALRGH
jgi:glycosyltransferase involved in cell wall biosynthesis